MLRKLFTRASLSALSVVILLTPLWAQDQEKKKIQEDTHPQQEQVVQEAAKPESPLPTAEAVSQENIQANTGDNTVALHNLTKLQELTSEVEARLETLVNLMSEERQSITEREDKLVQREASLAARAAEIAAAEERLKTQKTVSWVVLAIGIGAIIFAFVIPRGNANKAGWEPEGPSQTASKVEPKVVQEEPKQEEVVAEGSKATATKKTRAKTSTNENTKESVAASNNTSDSNGKKKASAS